MVRHRTESGEGNEGKKWAVAKALMAVGVLGCVVMGDAQRAENRGPEPDPRAPLTPELAAQLSQNADRSVIVILKNKVAGDLAAADQGPLMNELRQVKAAGIKPFRLVNAFAATVSEGELAHLKTHPAVDRVLPDVVIRRKARPAPLVSRLASSKAPAAAAASPQLVPATLNILPGACSSSARGLLDPEALSLTNTASDDATALTARSLGFTGAGVKVAAMADGVDVNNINFIRANGSSAFIDYQDFTGDGPTAPTPGSEAFLDYNAIAGQGIHVYDVSQYSAQTDPSPCNIRIQGVAPSASLVGLKIFSNFNASTTSNFIQAIEYAVQTHVDVLNQSFGFNLYPDKSFLDVISVFDDAAVAAGVTVVVSSGDAGPTNTIGSPASDPNVISVGATTSFRFYAQTNDGAARYFATTGWLSDNISAMSSSGFTQTGKTIDLVAPGDLAWASCDASANYSDCTNLLNVPSDVGASGGTSLSAPLTAGAAALVIQAYRSAHQGRSPSPALVKQILTSTATDLGVPANEQGAGLLNSYKAVLLAKSIDGGAPTGQTLLFSQNQLHATGLPGTNATWDVTVTNVSASPQTVTVSGRTFGGPQNVQSGSVEINPPGTQFTGWDGLPYTYQTFTFQVPPGAARLYASTGTTAATGRFSLIDPNGKFAAYSLPQGIGDGGNVDVRQPAPGTWTGVIFEGSLASGPVLWQVYTQQFAPFASVSPGAFSLAPGASRTLEISAVTPDAPGDAAGSIVLTASGGGTDPYLGPESNSIPVTLRSLVDIDHGGSFRGTFSGRVNGGNGRFNEGQVAYYQFHAGPGRESITASVSLTNDPQENAGLYLIDPNGVAAALATNFDAVTGANSLSATADVVEPVPGTWTVIVFVGTVAGNEIFQPFTGTVTLDQPDLSVSAPALPNDADRKLAAGVPVTIPITVSNHGPAPQDVFLDARLNTTAALTLADQAAPNNFQWPLPLPCCSAPAWLVPSETTSVEVSVKANVAVEFDLGPTQGDPDILGVPIGPDGARGRYSPAPSLVQPGLWFAVPSEFGPYGAAGAPPGRATASMIAQTQAFDPTVTASTGDFWLQSLNPSAPFAPISIGPGQTVTVPVTITPSGAPGTVVSGVLYVSTYAGAVPPYATVSGNEVAEIPYKYTIAKQ